MAEVEELYHSGDNGEFNHEFAVKNADFVAAEDKDTLVLLLAFPHSNAHSPTIGTLRYVVNPVEAIPFISFELVLFCHGSR